MTPQQIDAMKLALEALEGCHIYGDLECVMTPDSAIYLHPAITALEEALAEHAMQEVQRLGQEIEQEPVAWWNDTGTHIDLNVSGRGAPLYTAPPQRTWVGLTDKDWNRSKHNYDFRKGVDWAEPILKQKNGYAEE